MFLKFISNLLNTLYIKNIETLIAYIDSIDNRVNNNKLGIIYIIVSKIPFNLKVNINDEIVNPSIKLLKKYINIIIGIPITDIPNKNIKINKTILDVVEFLKQVK